MVAAARLGVWAERKCFLDKMSLGAWVRADLTYHAHSKEVARLSGGLRDPRRPA